MHWRLGGKTYLKRWYKRTKKGRSKDKVLSWQGSYQGSPFHWLPGWSLCVCVLFLSLSLSFVGWVSSSLFKSNTSQPFQRFLPRATLALVASWFTLCLCLSVCLCVCVCVCLWPLLVFNLFLPRATLALVASWLIQKETQESMTIRMEGRYVWNTK